MGRPRIKNPNGRRYVREALINAGGYGYSEESLLDQVNELGAPAQCNLSQLREWVEWNHVRQYVRVEFNEDLDEDLWFITQDGIAKENIK